MRHLLLGLCWIILSAISQAQTARMQDLGQLEQLAENFLKHELAMRAATWQLGKLDRKLAVPACPQAKVNWATPGVTTGSTFITASCPDFGWSLRIPVRISDKRMGIVLNRAVTTGEVLNETDIRLVDIANPSLAQNILSDPAQAIGQTMRSSAPAGAWLRNFMVRAPYLVRVNQRVRVIAQGDGFSANADGLAISNASLGEQVSVRMASGRVVRGQVQADGTVLVNY